MHLLLRRSQRDASLFGGLFGESMLFMLDARLDLTPDEQELFDRHQLGQLPIYDSDARAQHSHAAHESFDTMDEALDRMSSEKDGVLAPLIEALGHLGSGWMSAILTRLSLQITLGSLVEGQHMETESLEEIMAVHDIIKEGVTYLARYFNLAVTFDGREELDEY